MSLTSTYTSTGEKFFYHTEAMTNLRNGKGQPIITHVMLTDICNHKCAFCSVQHRAGDSLVYDDVIEYLNILKKYGLKSVILSGGGNPILYRCKKTGKTFASVVEAIHRMGLEIGLITNGMITRPYTTNGCNKRQSWVTVAPRILDMLTWVRISMAGLDHEESKVYVPDIGRKTTLGFSYVAHDIYYAPEDKKHGRVSTEKDLLRLGIRNPNTRVVWNFDERIPELTEQIKEYVEHYKPKYVRLLPNCLEPSLIEARCKQLQQMAEDINPSIVFVQYKPPKAPPACYLGYIHPVLNCDGYVYPCDSCVLNDAAGHQFANPWRICHWSKIWRIYEQPVRSLIDNPKKLCSGCVFTKSNVLLNKVVNGKVEITKPAQAPDHANFI